MAAVRAACDHPARTYKPRLFRNDRLFVGPALAREASALNTGTKKGGGREGFEVRQSPQHAKSVNTIVLSLSPDSTILQSLLVVLW